MVTRSYDIVIAGLVLVGCSCTCGDDDLAQSASGGSSTSTASRSSTGDEASATSTVSSAGTATEIGTTTDSGRDDASTRAGSVSSGTGSSSSSGSAPPFPEACYEPDALLDVTEATSPDGPLAFDEVWYGTDACSYRPYIVLAQNPTTDGKPGVKVSILLTEGPAPSAPWNGTYQALLFPTANATVTVLDPVWIDEGPDADQYFHAQIEVHDQGWNISAEVGVINCGDGDCYCPCE